jgi:hypothetical protein
MRANGNGCFLSMIDKSSGSRFSFGTCRYWSCYTYVWQRVFSELSDTKLVTLSGGYDLVAGAFTRRKASVRFATLWLTTRWQHHRLLTPREFQEQQTQ